MLVGCGGSDKEVEEVTYTELTPEIIYNHSNNYNGQIDFIDDRSWVFESHTNPLCIDKLTSACRKVNAKYIDGIASDRVTKYSFALNVNEINLDDSPYWVILFQDWVQVDSSDGNGNHPISTLKLKNFDGQLALAHYDNSWQWGYDHGDNVDGDKIDVDHSLHQENTLNGFKIIEVGVEYNIEIVIHDEGYFEFYVDDLLISANAYQTKHSVNQHAIQWGLYWAKGYNTDNDPLNRIVASMYDFKVLVLDR